MQPAELECGLSYISILLSWVWYNSTIWFSTLCMGSCILHDFVIVFIHVCMIGFCEDGITFEKDI